MDEQEVVEEDVKEEDTPTWETNGEKQEAAEEERKEDTPTWSQKKHPDIIHLEEIKDGLPRHWLDSIVELGSEQNCEWFYCKKVINHIEIGPARIDFIG